MMARLTLYITAVLASALLAVPSASAEPVRIEVPGGDPGVAAELGAAGIDVAAVDPDGVDVIAWDRADLRAIEARGLDWRRLPDPRAGISNLPVRLPSGRTTYRVWEDYVQTMERLARRHPSLVRLRTIGRSLLGRPILGVEIAREVWREDGRPSFFQYGLHHAREWPSGEWTIESAIDIVAGRDRPRIASLLDQVRFFFIPVVNVDGFIASRGAGPSPIGSPVSPTPVTGPGSNEYRRKNCRPLAGEAGMACSSRDPEGGVDLNRNYGYFWGGTGTDGREIDTSYRGPSPFSEPESRAIRQFTRRYQPTVLLSHHTYWEQGLWMRQPGFIDETIFPGSEAPDEASLEPLGDALAGATGWLSWRGFQLYPVSGATDDWAYLALGSLAMTSEGRGPDFHSYFSQMVGAEWPGVREAILRAAETAADAGSVISGQAPPGAVLTIGKQFAITTCQGFSDFEVCLGPQDDLPESSAGRMVVDRTGTFSWHVNPSSRPLSSGESWTVTCRAPGNPDPVVRTVAVSRGATAEVDFDACRPGVSPTLSAAFRPIGTPRAGEPVGLVPNAPDGSAPVVRRAWDLDGDGRFDDGAALVESKRWGGPGRKQVGLRVWDEAGNPATSRRTVTVRRPAPRWPSFSLSVVGRQTRPYRDVVFLVRGPLADYVWDLDGDGRFNDGAGRELSRVYRDVGSYRVSVRAVDADGRKGPRRSALVTVR